MALQLSRGTGRQNPKAAIWIGPDIRVTIDGIRGSLVEVSIEAPAGVVVLREEVKLQIEAGTYQRKPKRERGATSAADREPTRATG